MCESTFQKYFPWPKRNKQRLPFCKKIKSLSTLKRLIKDSLLMHVLKNTFYRFSNPVTLKVWGATDFLVVPLFFFNKIIS